MRKIVLFLVFVAGLNAEFLTIKQGGSLVEKEYSIKEDKMYVSKSKFFTNNDKIMIIFEDKNKKELLEKKYNLLNGRRMYGEKFIYEQDGENILKLLKTLSKEQNINTVYPNWTTIYNKN